ncbi:MAG: AEC family transporter [Oscillatoriophycideae cyanobacterium NC_groundwater_1537_Pr4_S-0.65um_50_18]|nr:AEC family transporter [Oscillatoriophycideae cyanobacterium NC_groundwater_1537_Pr4_S-0.65um_50_18]
MTDSLVQAYLPLFLWTGLGAILLRVLPESLPRLLGRSLYWVGVPLEILALARQTHFSSQVGLAPIVTIAGLTSSLVLAWLSLQAVRSLSLSQVLPQVLPQANAENAAEAIAKEIVRDAAEAKTLETLAQPLTIPFPLAHEPALHSDPGSDPWQDRARRGSFILTSIFGNTGFVGLAIAPAFIDSAQASWLVIYSVTQNVVGTYGIGVFLASYYGRSLQKSHWLMQIRDVLTVPSLWAFAIGYSTRSIGLPGAIELGIEASVWVVIPAALLLMGMRLSQLHGWASLRLAMVPAFLKVVVSPLMVGLLTSLMGLMGDARLALVLMAGMPSAFAGLILAEEYQLDRELIASSIVLSTGMLLLTLPLWLVLFD